MKSRYPLFLMLFWALLAALVLLLQFTSGKKPKYVFPFETKVPTIPCDQDFIGIVLEILNKKRDASLRRIAVSMNEQVKFSRNFHAGMNPNPGLANDGRARKLHNILEKMKPYTVSGLPYEVHVTDENDINAYTVAGKIYFTSGILELLDSDDELAMVMGHEIGHNENGHCIEHLRKLRQWDDLLPDWDIFDHRISELALGLEQILTISFNQPEETVADLCGTYLAHKAGYDPEKGREAFAKFRKLEISGDRRLVERLLRSHPYSDDRYFCVSEYLKMAEERAKNAPTVYKTIPGILCEHKWPLLSIHFAALFFVFGFRRKDVFAPSENRLSASLAGLLYLGSMLFLLNLPCIGLLPEFLREGKSRPERNGKKVVVERNATVKTRQDRLILRERPSQDSKELARMEKGERLYCYECEQEDVIYDRKGKWCRVKYKGQEGFAWGWLIQLE